MKMIRCFAVRLDGVLVICCYLLYRQPGGGGGGGGLAGDRGRRRKGEGGSVNVGWRKDGRVEEGERN